MESTMIYNKNFEHLIPNILLDRVSVLHAKHAKLEQKELIAQQLEVVRDYCEKQLVQYRKDSKTKHKANV
jgi:hypothetical protein